MIARHFWTQQSSRGMLSAQALARNMSRSAMRNAAGKGPGPVGPTHESRTSPRTDSTPTHPGYTSADTPVTSDHPSTMPGPSSSAKIAGYTTQASTRPHPVHPGIKDMAKGAEIGGEDAITPEERNVKAWGPNQRSPEFNPQEGRRNPVLHGGSNEGGHDSKGNSKT